MGVLVAGATIDFNGTIGIWVYVPRRELTSGEHVDQVRDSCHQTSWLLDDEMGIAAAEFGYFSVEIAILGS